jgi:hypothetical protein
VWGIRQIVHFPGRRRRRRRRKLWIFDDPYTSVMSCVTGIWKLLVIISWRRIDVNQKRKHKIQRSDFWELIFAVQGRFWCKLFQR